MDFRYHVHKHLALHMLWPLVDGEKKTILPLQFYADMSVFLGYCRMSNTFSFPTFTGWGLAWNLWICSEWSETKALRNPRACSTCAAAASAPRLLSEPAAAPGGRPLGADQALAPRECWECWVRDWQPRQPGSQLTEGDSLRDRKTRDRSTQASPDCSRFPLFLPS